RTVLMKSICASKSPFSFPSLNILTFSLDNMLLNYKDDPDIHDFRLLHPVITAAKRCGLRLADPGST
ncbi:hypothetical protein O5264_28860, partial [Escherichia coli]|nr:hypothetical protein [Escherichia coli]